jgi:hypothetical protein
MGKLWAPPFLKLKHPRRYQLRPQKAERNGAVSRAAELAETLSAVRYNFAMLVLTLTWIGLACWIVCFWWMHRISSRQDTVLKELQEMTARIERLSKAEHDLIQDVHPQVNEIKEHVQTMADAVSSDASGTKQ